MRECLPSSKLSVFPDHHLTNKTPFYSPLIVFIQFFLSISMLYEDLSVSKGVPSIK